MLENSSNDVILLRVLLSWLSCGRLLKPHLHPNSSHRVREICGKRSRTFVWITKWFRCSLRPLHSLQQLLQSIRVICSSSRFSSHCISGVRNPDKNALRAHTRLYLEYWYKILEINSIYVNTISTQHFTELSMPVVPSKIMRWKIVPYD